MAVEHAVEAAMLAMLAKCRRENLLAVCAICDDHGELLALFRRDGAPYSSVKIAIDKAYCAARERKSSRDLGTASRDPLSGFDLSFFGDARYTGWAGGVPVFVNNLVVASVGVSGLSEEEDERVAEIGRAKFKTFWAENSPLSEYRSSSPEEEG